MFEKLIEILKANPRKIVFPEGTDARILEAAARLKKDGFLTPVLIGNVDEVKAAAAKGGFDIEGLEIIDPANYPDMDKFVDDFVALRKGKATAEDARAMLLKSNYFGTMLVKEGLADSLLGGATSPPPTPCAPPSSSSRPRRAPTSSPPASFWPAATR